MTNEHLSHPLKVGLCGLLLALSGCATMSVEECGVADWYEVGVRDGSDGYDPNRQLARHSKACAEGGLSPDARAYRDGHAQGLQRFCQPQRAFSNANDGGDGQFDVCPLALTEAMRPAARLGRDMHRAAVERDELEASQHELFDELSDPELSDRERSHIETEIKTLERDIDFLELELAAMAAKAREAGWY